MKAYFIIILLGASTSIYGQTEKAQKAFIASYSNEYKQDYITSISDLMAVYSNSSYELNVRLGWLNYLAGEYDSSIKYYKIAITILPYSVEAKLGYALPLSAMGNWDEIIQVYTDILKTDPQNSIANYRLGSIYYARAQYNTALTFTEKVVNMYPFDFDSVILLAWINLKREDYRKAKILFNKSLLIQPANESALEGLKLIQ